MDNTTHAEDHTNYKEHIHERIPKIDDIKTIVIRDQNKMTAVDLTRLLVMKKPKYILYDNLNHRDELTRRNLKREYNFYNYCFISVIVSFIFGLLIGIVLMGSSQAHFNVNIRKLERINDSRGMSRTLNSLKHDVNKTEIKIGNDKINTFATVSFTGEKHKYKKDVYPKGLTEDMKDILKDNKVTYKHSINSVISNPTNFTPNEHTVLFNNIYWGPEVEDSMPQGYGENTAEIWEKYVDQSEVVKMETGCGRMQNRLVTFRDGIQACVRYRQNTDQIQGEIFSFYVGRLLNLTNLAPSVVKVVDLKDKLWQNVATDIATAQWNTNRAVVLTQYIPSLESATIPEIFKPANRHLNKNDVLQISLKENSTNEVSKDVFLEKIKTKKKVAEKDIANFDHIDMVLSKKTIKSFVELAQWSDLIIFDYLTANLDRIVNNLFNYQWNVNIMDGPAHNLARKMDSGLLLFLDNESGLLHGYRLLKKYNVYHSLMLDNLCVFRKKTVESLKQLYDSQSVGGKLSDMFHKKNSAVIRDILPPLPEKNAKILHERIGRVLTQIERCEQTFSYR